jgi:hypothetical protein
MIEVKESGDFDNTERFLQAMLDEQQFAAIDFYAQQGVTLLELATPRDSGVTAESWYYEITKRPQGGYFISWHNSHIDDQGVPIVLLIQYGHGTGTGGYVEGVDFINPATQEVFDGISDAVWKAVQSA